MAPHSRVPYFHIPWNRNTMAMAIPMTLPTSILPSLRAEPVSRLRRRSMKLCCWAALGLLAGIRNQSYGADDLQRPIQAGPGGHFLMHPDGTPFFYLGENVETLLWRLTREETDLYLKNRASKGFTVVMAQIVPKEDLNAPNAYGETAFIGGEV